MKTLTNKIHDQMMTKTLNQRLFDSIHQHINPRLEWKISDGIIDNPISQILMRLRILHKNHLNELTWLNIPHAREQMGDD